MQAWKGADAGVEGRTCRCGGADMQACRGRHAGVEGRRRRRGGAQTQAGSKGLGVCTVLPEVSHAQLVNNAKGSSFRYWCVAGQ